MTTFEKIYSLGALAFLVSFLILLFTVPQMRTLNILIPLSLLGFVVNAALLFLVFRDIFTRTFATEAQRYFWALLILFFLPALLIYLPKFAFKPRK